MARLRSAFWGVVLAGMTLAGCGGRPTGVLAPASPATAGAAKVDLLVAERLDAKRVKNFSEADRIRDELARMGVVLKDSKDGTTWEIAR